MRYKIASFISPHGFGHAARAAAVISAIHGLARKATFEIFTAVPAWFFKESLTGPYNYHRVNTDIGLVQKTPFEQDLGETVKRLDRFHPFRPGEIRRLAEVVRRAQCRLVLCDISPMGIAVAKEAGIPSVLIENFTWDWIYEEYVGRYPGFRPHIDYLQGVFASADYRIQAEPVCKPTDADLVTRPVSRKPRTPPSKIRNALGIPQNEKAVIVTMGGFPQTFSPPDHPLGGERVHVIMPGGADALQREGHFLRLPRHSGFYHPDLINACDAVISKVGYSTLAESFHAGLPFGYIPRADFRESPFLSAFIRAHMTGVHLDEALFHTGRWTDRLYELLNFPAAAGKGPNGGDQAAAFIHGLLAKG